MDFDRGMFGEFPAASNSTEKLVNEIKLMLYQRAKR